jgi:hypothetical protein
VVDFATLAQFKMLNLRLFSAQGSDFGGFILSRFADQ